MSAVCFISRYTGPTPNNAKHSYSTLQNYTVLSYPTPHSPTFRQSPTLFHTLLHCATLSYTVPHYPTLFHIPLHCATLSYTLPHSPSLLHTPRTAI